MELTATGSERELTPARPGTEGTERAEFTTGNGENEDETEKTQPPRA